MQLSNRTINATSTPYSTRLGTSITNYSKVSNTNKNWGITV